MELPLAPLYFYSVLRSQRVMSTPRSLLEYNNSFNGPQREWQPETCEA